MPDIEKKLRIQLFDKDMNMLSDRLVTQYTEFSKGPQEPHKGPLKIEACLFTKEDVDLFKGYLDAVRGDIPMDSYKSKRGRKKSVKSVEGFRDHMVREIEEYTSIDQLVKELRDNGFVFSSLALLKDMGYPIQVGILHQKKYKFMVRLMRKAKNPLNDKYDPSLLIGFSDNKVLGYSGEDIVLEKEFEDTKGRVMIKIPAKAKVKFPDYLHQDERNKFRAEMQLLKDNPDKNPSKFYQRWVWEVKKSSPEGIEFPRIDSIISPY